MTCGDLVAQGSSRRAVQQPQHHCDRSRAGLQAEPGWVDTARAAALPPISASCWWRSRRHVAMRFASTSPDPYRAVLIGIPDSERFRSTWNGASCLPSTTGRIDFRAPVRRTKCGRSSVAFSSRPNRTCQPAPSLSAGTRSAIAEMMPSEAALAISGMVRCSGLHASRRARAIDSGAVAISRSSASDRMPQRTAVALRAGGRRQHHEAHAAMNRENARAVVESKPAVDRGPIEQMPAQRRAPVIGRDPRRHDQADAPARPGEGQRALHEQLVAVGMPAALMLITPRRAAEPQLRGRHRSRVRALRR